MEEEEEEEEERKKKTKTLKVNKTQVLVRLSVCLSRPNRFEDDRQEMK